MQKDNWRDSLRAYQIAADDAADAEAFENNLKISNMVRARNKVLTSAPFLRKVVYRVLGLPLHSTLIDRDIIVIIVFSVLVCSLIYFSN